jgi:hypothetical protein
MVIPLPKGESIEVFLDYYEKDDRDPITDTYHKFKGYYLEKSSLNFLTEKIINYYVIKFFRSHVKFFSIEGNVALKLEKR